MTKAYNRINWQNEPSTDTALNEQNLNKMDLAINVIDDRVVALDTSKASASDVLTMFTGASYNESTGVLTLTRANGTTVTIDTKLEKLAVNFTYNATTQKLVITLDDGTTQEVDLSALINEYDFETSDTVSFTVSNGKVTAEVVDGSITADKLQPDYLADIRVEAARAEGASAQADLAKSYAVGGTGTRTGEDTDNAKYYAERAEAVSQVSIATTDVAGVVKPDGTTITIDLDGTIHSAGGTSSLSWDNITDKPSTFTPSSHTHTKSEITDFPTTMTPSAHTHVVADITDLDKASTTNLGLVKVDGTTVVINDEGTISAIGGGGGGGTTPTLATVELEVLGWNVPSGCPVQNELNGNEFTQNVGRVDLSTLSWEDTGYSNIFRNRAFPGVCYGATVLTPMYCEGYTTELYSDDGLWAKDHSIAGYDTGSQKVLGLHNSDYTAASQLATGLSGVFLYYQLVTPVTTTVSGGGSTSDATHIVGDSWSVSRSYSAGDYCIYSNTLYKCKVACTGQIPTSTSYWSATSVTNELKTKNIVTTTAPTAGATSTYPVGTTIDVIE